MVLGASVTVITLGDAEGRPVLVGLIVGSGVACVVGDPVGVGVCGTPVGATEGFLVGPFVVGFIDGDEVGFLVGDFVVVLLVGFTDGD